MDSFTDPELVGIMVALELARKVVREGGRIQAPLIFESIEARVRTSLQVSDPMLDELIAEAIGDLRWVH